MQIFGINWREESTNGNFPFSLSFSFFRLSIQLGKWSKEKNKTVHEAAQQGETSRHPGNARRTRRRRRKRQVALNWKSPKLEFSCQSWTLCLQGLFRRRSRLLPATLPSPLSTREFSSVERINLWMFIRKLQGGDSASTVEVVRSAVANPMTNGLIRLFAKWERVRPNSAPQWLRKWLRRVIGVQCRRGIDLSSENADLAMPR